MTVNVPGTTRFQYTGNGVTVNFAYSARCLDQTHIKVLADGVLKTITTDYTVVVAPGGGSATVTMLVAPANGVIITLAPNVPLSQLADYTENDPFPAETHEDALDKLTIITQQQQDNLNRALSFPSSSSVALTPVLPTTPVADAALTWDGTTGAVKNGPTTTDISNAAANAATATAQAALALLYSQAAQGAVTALANKWAFATSTTMADPSAGNIRLNNATPASVTQIAISAQSNDTGNPNVRTYLLTMDDANHTPRAIIRVQKDANNWANYGVNGAITDNTSWLQVPVTYINGAGSFAASDALFITNNLSGNDGATGGTTLAINAQTGTTYTAVLGDAGGLTTLTNAGAITYTVPTNASVAFPVGTQILLQQGGAGQVTVAGAGGVTVNKPSTRALKARNQYSFLLLVKTATDTWSLGGDMESV